MSQDSLPPPFRSLEISWTDFIFETLLKLESLTEARVFLCVESRRREGRRFGGSKDLVDAFLAGRLGGAADDVEVTLDKSTNVLREAPPRRPRRKRRSHYEDEDEAPSSKRASLADERFVESDSTTTMTTTTPYDTSFGPVVLFSEPEVGGGLATPIKTETTPSGFVSGVVADLDDDFLAQNALSPSPSRPGFCRLPTSDRLAAKIAAIQSVADPWLVYKKGTVENKLFSSVFYEFGRDLAFGCGMPDPSLKDPRIHDAFYDELRVFIAANFSRFDLNRDENPNLGEDDNCLKKYSAMAYMRDLARGGFKKGVIIMTKKRA